MHRVIVFFSFLFSVCLLFVLLLLLLFCVVVVFCVFCMVWCLISAEFTRSLVLTVSCFSLFVFVVDLLVAIVSFCCDFVVLFLLLLLLLVVLVVLVL